MNREYLSFRVDQGRYALPCASVAEVRREGAVTLVPGAPRFVAGVVTVHGHVAPVIDARARLGLTAAPADPATLLVLAEQDRLAAVRVDGIDEILTVDDGGVEPIPALVGRRDRDLYSGVIRRSGQILTVLSAAALMDPAIDEDRTAPAVDDAGPARVHVHAASGPTVAGEAYVFVRAGGERYALAASVVQELRRPTTLTRLPGSPTRVLGLLADDAGTQPVIDLRRRLGAPAESEPAVLLFVRAAGHAYVLAVDEVLELRRVAPASLQPAPELVRTLTDEAVEAVVLGDDGALALVLDPGRVLTRDELQRLNPGERGVVGNDERAAVRGSAGLDVIVLTAGGLEFAIPTAAVREMLPAQTLTRVPLAPDFVDGVCAVRGEVLPVVNLGRRLGLRAAATAGQLAVVTEAGNRYALALDGLVEMMRVPLDRVAPAPGITRGVGGGFLDGVLAMDGGRTIFLLSLAAVVAHERRGPARGEGER